MPAYVMDDEKKGYWPAYKGQLEVLFQRQGKWLGLVVYPTNKIIVTKIENILCDGMDALIKSANK